MKTRLTRLTILLALTAALLAGCAKPDPTPQPDPAPSEPQQEQQLPSPGSEGPSQPVPQPAPELPDPADPEPQPVPVVPEPADPEQEGPTLLKRLDRAYTYRAPEREETYYIEFKTVNNRLFAEVAAQMDTGSRFTYWMAELNPIDAEALLNGEGEPCPLRSREFSGFSLDGAYWGKEEVISLTMTGDGLTCQKGEQDHLLSPADSIEDIHDEADLRRYLQLVDDAKTDAASLAAAKLPGVWEGTVNEGGSLVSVYLELEEDGLFWLMRDMLDEPAQLYRGAYGVSSDGKSIHYSAERLGYGNMPYLGRWEIAGGGAQQALRLTDSKDSQIELCTGVGAYVEFYPAGSDVSQEFFPGTVFTYNGKDHDVTQYAPAVNAIMDTYTVGKHIVVEGHVGPKNGVYLIFNTETEEFEQELAGNNLIWHSNDINTAVFAFWGDIYTYDGKLIGTVEEQGEFYIDELAFSPDREEVLVTAQTVEGAQIFVSFAIPK